MITRVSDSMKYSVFAEAAVRLKTGTQNVTEKIVSGKEINKSSDDPEGTRLVLALIAKGEVIDGRRGNIAFAQTWLESTAASLTAVNDFLAQAEGWAQTALPLSTEERSSMAGAIQDISDQMLSLANSKTDGRFLFSGSLTAVEPFAVSSTSPTPPYEYKGNDAQMAINVGKDESESYNVPGEAVFLGTGGGVDIFQGLQDLKTALEQDDSAAITVAGDKLADAVKQVQNGITKTKLMQKSMEISDSRLADQRNSIVTQIEGVQNADISKLAMEFQMQAIVLNALYDSTFRTSQLSILNFLK